HNLARLFRAQFGGRNASTLLKRRALILALAPVGQRWDLYLGRQHLVRGAPVQKVLQRAALLHRRSPQHHPKPVAPVLCNLAAGQVADLPEVALPVPRVDEVGPLVAADVRQPQRRQLINRCALVDHQARGRLALAGHDFCVDYSRPPRSFFRMVRARGFLETKAVVREPDKEIAASSLSSQRPGLAVSFLRHASISSRLYTCFAAVPWFVNRGLSSRSKAGSPRRVYLAASLRVR